jgi:multicomponent Na+:H+ antiporter subunit F
MPAVVVVPAMVWVTLLLIAGGLALVRARDVQQRVIALDLLAVVVVALLAYLWDVGYYLDAAVARSSSACCGCPTPTPSCTHRAWPRSPG